MSIRGYVLVETEVGRTQAVGHNVRGLTSQNAKILAVDTVTGPFDVIVQLEAEDLDLLGKCITEEYPEDRRHPAHDDLPLGQPRLTSLRTPRARLAAR